jgi:hypothetical protein
MNKVIPLPVRPGLFVAPAARPGDWWEPLPRHDASVAAALYDEGSKRRLPIDLLAAVLIEHSLVERDLADCGLDARTAMATLNDASELGSISGGPGRLNTPYVHMLRAGDRCFEPESRARLAARDLMLPLRLLGRTAQLSLEDVFSAAALDDAIRWEIAAATADQFMREWALQVLLAAATA